jgi:hypothetical protein
MEAEREHLRGQLAQANDKIDVLQEELENTVRWEIHVVCIVACACAMR